MGISFLLLMGIILNAFLALFVVFFERKNVKSTWIWIMILFFLPLAGFILYLYFGIDYRKRKIFDEKKNIESKYLRQVELQKQIFRNRKSLNNNSYFEDVKNLIKLNLETAGAVYSNRNTIKFYFDGKDKFKDLFIDIENAKKYIYIEYYIFKYDDVGKKMLGILEKKLKDGVIVKLLVDGVGSKKLRKKHLQSFMENGGEYRVFFPLKMPLLNTRFNFRNHRKIVVIDGKVAYSGGFNVGEEYMYNTHKFGYWRDTHYKISGDCVEFFLRRFENDYRFASGEKIKEEEFEKRIVKGNVGIQFVTSGPDSQYPNIKNAYIKMISSAQKKIWIQTPYLILDESVGDALKIAAMSGVDVRIMIPSKPDHPFVYWATYSCAGSLIGSGVKIYVYDNGFLHAKTIIIDDIMSSVGTANFDVRSFELNFEGNAFIYDKKVNKLLELRFIEDMNKSKELSEERYNKRSLMIKFKEGISRLLSPLL